MSNRFIAVLLLLTLFVAACGTTAEPRPTFEATNTALPRAANLEDEEDTTENESTEEVAEVEPTAVPPTATLAPTATVAPTLEPTEEVTEEPTVEATEEIVEEAAAVDEVVVNGVVGDAASGEFWFTGGGGSTIVNYQSVDRSCSSCHEVAEPIPGSGPYLYGIGLAAAEHAPEGMSATDYLAESILNPGAIIAPSQVGPDGTEYNWDDGIMPTNWNTVLDDQLVADLVAYLMSLTQEGGHEHQH